MSRSFARYLAPIAAAAFTLSAVNTAQAAQLVTNGGFETGNFTGWTQSGNTGFTYVGAFSTTGDTAVGAGALGNHTAFLGPVGSTGSLSQALNTVVGDSYSVSFVVSNLGASANSFKAVFGSDVIVQVSGSPSNVMSLAPLGTVAIFSTYTNTFTATSTLTPITFTFRQDPSYWALDNVSVIDTSAVPEPATWALMLVGFGAIGVGLRGSMRRDLLTA